MLNIAAPTVARGDAHSGFLLDITEQIPWTQAEKPLLFFPSETTLLQPVTRPSIPNSIESYVHRKTSKLRYSRDGKEIEEELMQKPESHITIIGFDHGRVIRRRLSEIEQEQDNTAMLATQARIQDLIDKTAFRYKLLPYYYKMQRTYNNPTPYTEIGEVRTTIIQLVQVDGLGNFYRDLSKILDLDLLPPPAHITLYSHSTNQQNMNTGIGLPTEECFKKLVQASIPQQHSTSQLVQ